MKSDAILIEKPALALFATFFGVVLLASGCSHRREAAPMAAMSEGRTIFATHCAACHQPDGVGSETGGPPLDGSPWVSGPESRLIRIVLHGVRGPIEIDGVIHDREMLSFGLILADEQIASLLTFVRSQWGGPAKPITPAAVSRVRSATRDRVGYWTVDELLDIP